MYTCTCMCSNRTGSYEGAVIDSCYNDCIVHVHVHVHAWHVLAYYWSLCMWAPIYTCDRLHACIPVLKLRRQSFSGKLAAALGFDLHISNLFAFLKCLSIYVYIRQYTCLRSQATSFMWGDLNSASWTIYLSRLLYVHVARVYLSRKKNVACGFKSITWGSSVIFGKALY